MSNQNLVSLLCGGSQRLWHLRVVWVPYTLNASGAWIGSLTALELIDPFLLPLH